MLKTGVSFFIQHFGPHCILAIGAHCVFISELPLVSASKFFLWSLVFLSFLVLATANGGPSLTVRHSWLKEIRQFLFCVIGFSLPATFLDAGYFVNGTGFQGILSHPQSFGFIAAISFLVFFDRCIWGRFSLAHLRLVPRCYS